MSAVLDASAVLAYLQREPGYERVGGSLAAGAAMSAVNLAEIASRLTARGLDVAAVALRLAALGLEVEPFTEADAHLVGALFPKTAPHGLSLGDRACLALGIRLGRPVVTADRAWADVDPGVEVVVVR